MTSILLCQLIARRVTTNYLIQLDVLILLSMDLITFSKSNLNLRIMYLLPLLSNLLMVRLVKTSISG